MGALKAGNSRDQICKMGDPGGRPNAAVPHGQQASTIPG